jgi:hypothetical protein
MRTRVIFTAVAFLGILALTVPAHATKGGGKGGPTRDAPRGTISVNQADPHYGDTVTFTVTTSNVNNNVSLRIQLLCTQSGSLVWADAGGLDGSFQLAGPNTSGSWTGGAAYCDATLYYFTYQGQMQTGIVTLGETRFSVGP